MRIATVRTAGPIASDRCAVNRAGGAHSLIALDKPVLVLSDAPKVGGLEEAISDRKLGEATLTPTNERK